MTHVDLFGKAPCVRVIDMEMTGLELDAKVCEVGWCDFDPKTYAIGAPASYLCRVGHMPPETRAVHHIRLEDTLAQAPYDRWIVYEEAMRAGVVAFAAHNADAEARYILGSLPLICTYKAALRVWPECPSHGLFALLYWLEDNGLVRFDRELARPQHRAGPDAYATAHVLAAIYQAGHTGSELMRWTQEPPLMPRCPIGVWRGTPWEDVEYSFLEWILYKARDMNPDVRWNAQRELDRRNDK